MVRLVHEQKLELGWIEFAQALAGREALHAGYSDIGHATAMLRSHLDLDPFRRIESTAMLGSLLDQLAAMCKYYCLSSSDLGGWNVINKMAEYDSLARSSRQT
jgi:hypothetical protein